MFKKEFFLIFTVIGLAIAYGFFTLLVFLTRGKKGNLLVKKITLGTMIIAFTAVLNTGAFTQSQNTPTPTPAYGTLQPVSTALVTPEPLPEYGTTLVPTPQMDYGTPQMGDVNGDYQVDIVDALLIAQYYVGLIPDPNMDYGTPIPFNPDYADVDRSTVIDIVDALLVSQKYVGLIDEYPDNSPKEEY